MYESSKELLKLTQKSSVHAQTHARIQTQYTPRVEQICGRCPTTTKGPPSGGGTDAIHTQRKAESEYVLQRLQAGAASYWRAGRRPQRCGRRWARRVASTSAFSKRGVGAEEHVAMREYTGTEPVAKALANQRLSVIECIT